MSQETLNILIGAGIAILSSLIASILTFIFQSVDAKRKRVWQFEDAELQQVRLVKEKRIEQIEESLNKGMTTWNQIQLELSSHKQLGLGKIADLILNSLCNEPVQVAPTGILSDQEITELLKKFSNTLFEIIRVISKHEFASNTKDVLTEVLKYTKDINNIYERSIKRLDELKISIISESKFIKRP